MSKVSNLNTVPLTGFLGSRDQELAFKYTMEYLEFISILPENLVKHHKERLGKQSFCFSNNRRYWVWEKENWCVYVNNDMGVQIEISPESSLEDAWEAWVQYKEHLQLPAD